MIYNRTTISKKTQAINPKRKRKSSFSESLKMLRKRGAESR